MNVLAANHSNLALNEGKTAPYKKYPAARGFKSGRMRAQFLEKLMTLLKFSDVSLAFGSMPLLDKVSWQIARGERVCIIGRNGTGKSSMMKLVKGDQKPDDGSVWRAPGLKIGELP